MLQSDNNFARTYKLKGLDGSTQTNQVYLTGLGKRNYFDLRSFYFDVQDADPDEQGREAAGDRLSGDGLSLCRAAAAGRRRAFGDVNFTNISRGRTDFYDVAGFDRYRGLKGQTSRLSGELVWKRTFTTPEGVLITPLLSGRGDAFALNMDDPTGYTGNYDNGDAATRGMVTAGLEMRYPILGTTANSTHLFEPIVQVYARPNESLAGALPNEDSQSMVFDATNLFERDKFSGYDRMEGGTRANVGFQYTGTFDSGYKLHGIFGQSYQLGGQNSFDTDDLVNAGAESGLETTRSDYVGLGGIETPAASPSRLPIVSTRRTSNCAAAT
jgi:LPS-assembly protein